MKNSDKPAFPITEEETDRVDYGIDIYTGLTKREYFAAMAVQGILASGTPWSHNMDNMMVTLESVKIADKILEELNNKKS